MENINAHKNNADINCRWALALLFGKGTRFVTKISKHPKTFEWESGKEPLYFESKEYADDIAFGIFMNLYPVVVMEVPVGLELRNPDENKERERGK